MSDLVSDARKAAKCLNDAAAFHTGQSILEDCADKITEQAAEIERLKAGLTRIATPCAFYVATSDVDPEAFARMIYAEKVAGGVDLSEADAQTEAETRKRYPLPGDTL